MEYENRLISDSQKKLYGKVGRGNAEKRLHKHKDSLAKFFGDNKLLVVDLGGGAGSFANVVVEFFNENNTGCSASVIDYVRYDEWSQYENIAFIEGSIFSELDKFADNSVDIVFINHVLHHLVTDSYNETRKLQKRVLALSYKKLKPGGSVFISECYYCNPMLNNLSTPIVYLMSSSKLPFMIKVSKVLGSKSAGVGVCFLSKNTWLKEFKEYGFDIADFQNDKMRWVKPLLIKEEFFSFVLTKK